MSRNSQSRLTPDEYWRIYLTEGRRGLNKHLPLHIRPLMNLEPYLFRFVPSSPRCVSCMAPFKGPGLPLMRAIGRQQSSLNPSICAVCENYARRHGAKAEVDLAALFADVRGSTKLAESMPPADYGNLINRFFVVATQELVRAFGMVEKLVGDEVTAFFVSGLAGKHYHRQAVMAAHKLLRATGHSDPSGPWIPVGIGIHSGETLVGSIGTENGLSQISILGDTANTAARLASLAKTREILISDETAQNAEIDTKGLEQRQLELKGKSEPVTAWVMNVGA